MLCGEGFLPGFVGSFCFVFKEERLVHFGGGCIVKMLIKKELS